MRLGIIGAGRVGASFVLALRSAVEIVGIACSCPESVRQKAGLLAVKGYEDLTALAKQCDVILLTTSDRAIGSVASQLAESHALEGHDVTVLHCSGAMGLEPLAPLAAQGVHVGSLHPLQSFSMPDGHMLHQIYMAVDGDDTAQAVGKEFASLVDSKTFHVPAEERALYHCAACFCSNYAVTVEAIAQTLMDRWTGSPEDSAKALEPLLTGTMQNLLATALWRKALTGPISRGDGETLQKHLALLPQELQEVYTSLGQITAILAEANGTITKDQRSNVEAILAMMKGERHE